MDSEAASRGTTVYLVDKRIDMLPALLGTNLCSLRPHVERLAFSVIWVGLADGGSRRIATNNVSATHRRCRDHQRQVHKVRYRFKSGI